MNRVVVDDLAFVAADAIVRPTNTQLEPVSSALRRLDDVGGPAFRQHLVVTEELAIGAAVVTGAGDLGSDLVIHAVISGPGEPIDSRGVTRALENVLQRAKDWEVAHLALPPIGVGPGNLPIEESARLIAEALGVTATTARYPREVTIVVDREDDRDIFEARLPPHPKDK